jgi:hypothetical protein
MKKILSIQGGGIRGIIPCLALMALEEQLGGLTKDHIDMVAGTSTGALLAACVVTGVPAAEALKVYTSQGKYIFSPTFTAHRYLNLVEEGHQFDNVILHQIVRDTLGSSADMTINDSPIDVLITAVDMGGERKYFVKDSANSVKKTGHYTVLDAAVASACATTYHGAYLISGDGFYFDGGTGGLADPIWHAAKLAFKLGPYNPAETRIINLGTGRFTPAKMPDPPVTLLEGVSWVTSSLVTASKTEAQEDVDMFWPGITTGLFPELAADIDEADVSAIPLLLEIGKRQADKLYWKALLL